MEQNKDEKLTGMPRRRSRRNDREQKKNAANIPYIGIAATAVILTLGAGIGFYLAKSGAYQETFMPNTTINGMDVAGKDIEEVKAMIEEELAGYELAIIDRTGAGEVIKKEEIGLRTEFKGGLEQILEIQEPVMWVKALWTEVDYQMDTMLVYDETLLRERIRSLSFMDARNMEKPQNAYLSEYQDDINGYEIVPEYDGTELLEDAVIEAISGAVLNMQKEVDLDAQGCYTEPEIQSEDPELVSLAENLNHYTGTSVTHRFGSQEEVLDGDTIHQWLTVDGQTVTLDESKPAEYVRTLARKYNTAYGKRPFLTTYGDKVTVPGGSYGWRMNEKKEAAAVLDAVKGGVIVTREPEWMQEGASHGEYDYGDTYVEINLTGQHLFFYKNGELLVECDFVSGNASKSWSTPAGIYPLTYKERNATLRGENYATPVSYWMPFNGNVGLHDADWRDRFGGTLYKTNGSHGCVNLPPKAAKIIYENISKGDPVICYHLEGTESKQTSGPDEINTGGVAAIKPDAGSKKPVTGETPAVPETKPAETAPAVPETETAVPETTPAVPETEPAEAGPTGPAEMVPEGAGSPVPETPSAVPEGVLIQNQNTTPEGVLSETRPAGPDSGRKPEGPGDGMVPETEIGPGNTPSGAVGNGNGPGFGDSGFSTTEENPGGPGYQTPDNPEKIGPGY